MGRLTAFLRGFIESRGDVGMTYDDPYSPRSVAYDRGRNLGRQTIARGMD